MQEQPVAREYAFEHEDFKKLAAIVYETSGITLGDHKKDMVYGRLSKRLRQLQIPTFSQYINYILNQENTFEVEQLINAITTNLTHFFREKHHFDHMKDVVIPNLAKQNVTKIRMWSAACSSGLEPYSMAMTAQSSLASHRSCDLKILATDLDTKMLQTARTGLYDVGLLKDIPENYREMYTKTNKSYNGRFEIKANLRSLIHFNQMNLMREWPMKGQFDIVFCRNVLIYFNNEDKAQIISKLINKLKVGGYLYMGHAESILNPPETLQSVAPTTYQRRV
ncbi:MAG: protein-glutamate O-methyltransferase [Pseudomonadota bacterium]